MMTSPGQERPQGRGGAVRQVLRRIRPDITPLRHSADYRRLYAGQGASMAGSMITFIALPYQAFHLTHSTLVVGLLSFTELVPLVLSALLGGLLADAADRRVMILAAEVIGAVSAAVLAVNAALWHQVWLLFVVSVVAVAGFGLQRPSVDALVPQLVPRDDLSAAAALSGLTSNAAELAGPLLGGVLIAAAGLPAAFWIDAATSLIALAAFSRLSSFPPAPEADRPSLRSLAEGIRYVRSRQEILGSYLIDIAAMFFGAPYAVFPAFAARLGGPEVLGLLYAAPGAGALLVSATSGWTRHIHRHGRAIAVAVCGWGLAIAAFGLAANLWWAVAALAAAGGADMVSGVFRTTLWNQTIPSRLRGRLAGLEMISYTTGQPLGDLESGLAASLTGSIRVSVVSGGLACLAGAAAVVAVLPLMWRYDERTYQAEQAPGAAPAGGAGAGAAQPGEVPAS
ncbi:MAG TPA: MFS transporter [Streptosporangiaceae bacterium]|nr:MFS transporter [Streptosporangiaceae bacterium]